MLSQRLQRGDIFSTCLDEAEGILADPAQSSLAGIPLDSLALINFSARQASYHQARAIPVANPQMSHHEIPDAGVTGAHPVPITVTSSSRDRNSTTGTARPPPQRRQDPRPRPASTPCKFFGTKTGCRADDRCPFLHDPNILTGTKAPSARPADDSRPSQRNELASGSQTLPIRSRQYVHEPVDPARVVSRPVPASETADPRRFQIQQLRRRFTPTETEDAAGTSLTIRLIPSDPDFPFELDALQCVLDVPSTYPDGKAVLRVTDPNIPRGFQINVERGFDELVRNRPRATLLQWMNALDKNLERYLAEEKTATVKLVANRPQTSSVSRPTSQAASAPEPASKAPPTHVEDATAQAEARARRETETRQLEARLGRQPGFSKAADGLTYVVPLTPNKPADLPVIWHDVRSVSLIVPPNYPLQACRVEFSNVQRAAAEPVEAAFERRATAHPEMSLMSHMNYLAQNLHAMATAKEEVVKEKATIDTPVSTATATHESRPQPEDDLDDRRHLVKIPRPPEWMTDHDASDDESDSTSSESESEGEEAGPADAIQQPGSGEQQTGSSISRTERGTSISFPSLELYGIELLDLFSLSFIVRCDRCKHPTEIMNLRHGAAPGEASLARVASCDKCAHSFGVAAYRGELIHAHSVRAGFLDLEGCSVVDLLPSNFLPTCAACSTTYSQPGVVSVRGETSVVFCRECHGRMSFTIPEVKFLVVSSVGGISARLPLKAKKVMISPA
ncbi:MAG: hypothetical protein M1823_000477 [Watsoniomyces obsoletus]|nr:MAG: hypothetical protein M1823_000477 [Watsoniomyces obsoletus]